MNQLPLRLDVSPLPLGFVGSPQDISDAIEARATIVSDQAFSIFSVGPTAPTSDYGPFFLNGVTPYGWNTVSGSYKPMVLDPTSLRYGIFPTGSLPANNNDYDVIFEKDVATGAPVGIDLWVTGTPSAWTPYPFAAQSLAAQRYSFTAIKFVTVQTVAAGAGITQITFDGTSFDAGSCFTGNQFTAKAAGYYHFDLSAYVELASGAPTNIELHVYLRVNGSTFDANDAYTSTDTGGRTYKLAGGVKLNVGDIVDAAFEVNTTGPSTWDINQDNRRTHLGGFLVQTV